jgi:hypothetical protein
MNLEQRVAALESLTAQLAEQAGSARTSARRWRAAALATGLALVGGVGVAASSSRQVQDVITAESIEIVDGDENVVMELTSDSSGGYLSLRNADEDEMAIIRCDDFGGIFQVNNADEGRAASMEVDVAGGLIMVRSVDDDQVGAMMDIINGGGRIYVNDGDGGEDEFTP